jgi:cysteine synthase
VARTRFKASVVFDGVAAMAGMAGIEVSSLERDQLLLVFPKKMSNAIRSILRAIGVQAIERSIDIEIHDAGGNHTAHESPQEVPGF